MPYRDTDTALNYHEYIRLDTTDGKRRTGFDRSFCGNAEKIGYECNQENTKFNITKAKGCKKSIDFLQPIFFIWSEQRESNSHQQLGKLWFCH